MVFRYIPAGPFLMGSEDGDPDDAPVHERDIGDFWLCETPLSLADYIFAWSGERLAFEDFLTWRAGRSDDAAGQVNDYMAFRLGGFLASHFDSSWRSRLFQRRRVWSG
jgi:formylglycine-generating enzyme required for sulfatase activity